MVTNRYDASQIAVVCEQLKAGKIIAFPTDTVFGLGCICEEEAMEKIYLAKGRREDKPLPMMCSSLEMIKTVALTDRKIENIYQGFLPGALTLILEKKEEVPSFITHGFPTIGIRVPDDSWILKLITMIGSPLLVTSANLSDQGSLLEYEDVLKQLDGRIDGIVCENARGQKASTILDCKNMKILRQGELTLEEISSYLEKQDDR